MEAIKKALGNAPVFVIAYVMLMLPTYYLPYLGSNSAVLHGVDAMAGSKAFNVPFWLHMLAMLGLCFACWVRGAYVDRKWILVFPVLAIVFDFAPGLAWIPMIPTLLHISAIIGGIAGAKVAGAQAA